MMWIAVAIAIIAAFAAAYFLAPRKPVNRAATKPYDQIRKDLISELADENAATPPIPVRPSDPDTRLPAARGDELARLFPPSNETWPKFFKLWLEVRDSVDAEISAIDSTHTNWFELVSPGRRAIVLIEGFEAEVNNGAFDQYYLNSTGDGAAWLPEALRLFNQEQVAEMVERCNAVFPGGPARDRGQRLAAMDKLSEEERDVWSKASDEFLDIDVPFGGLAVGGCVPYVLANRDEFFKQ